MTGANRITRPGWRRKGAWAGLVCLIALPFGLAAWNVSEAFSLRASAAGTAAVLAAQQDRLGAADAGQGDRENEAQRGFLEGNTAGIAGAGLQAELRNLIEAAGAVAMEMEPLERAEDALEGSVRVRVTFDARNDALQQILIGVESGAVALLVRSLAIAPIEAADGDPTLRVTAVVEGFWQEGAL